MGSVRKLDYGAPDGGSPEKLQGSSYAIIIVSEKFPKSVALLPLTDSSRGLQVRMPLQNRCDPFGTLHAVTARGLFTGNRGVIHDPDTKKLLGRRWTTRAWIICECEFRGKRREVMGRNAPGGGAGWTELFFLDEVTGLAAGHRPCFYCRRKQAEAFVRCFGSGQGLPQLSAPEVDARLHRERRTSGGPLVRLELGELVSLPDGATVARNERAFAVRRGRLMAWDFTGYGPPQTPSRVGDGFVLLTPRSTVAALREGYKPVWHPSAGP